jgi:hypothetical protein
MNESVFFETIIQPKGNIYIFPIIMSVFIIIVAVVTAGLMAGVISASKNTSISISGNEIIINSFIYGRKIPIENVLLDGIQKINLKDNKEFDISIKTNGVNVPNFSSGWMRLKNKEKALVFITDKENVLMIPTKDFKILFSMKKTDEFMNKIRAIKQ